MPDLDSARLKILGDVVKVLRGGHERRVLIAIGVLRQAARPLGLFAVLGGVIHAVQTTAAKLGIRKFVG